MSDPATPSPTAGVVNITPSDKTSEAPVRLVHSTSEILDLFVDILDKDDTNRDKLKQGVEHLLTEHWHVCKWADMQFFTSEDVKAALVPGHGMPAEELLAPVIVKKVGGIIDYAKIGILTADLTLDDIMGVILRPRIGSHLLQVLL
jgi:hypothetical protein